MKKISKKQLEEYKQYSNYEKYNTGKVLYSSKLVDGIDKSGVSVEVIGCLKGKDLYNDRYIIRLNDGSIYENILSSEIISIPDIDDLKNAFKNRLNSKDEYEDYEISYIINHSDIDCYTGFALNDEKMCSLSTYDCDINDIPDWDYDFDNYLFCDLEKDNTELEYVDLKFHYNIWCYVNDIGIESINYKDGFQIYLNYCIENNITKGTIDECMQLNTPDIMKYSNCLNYGDIVCCDGYIAEIGGYNDDNKKERLVHIYKNQSDYDEGVITETVSLYFNGIEEEINNYIENKYNRNNLIDNSELSYITYVLGSDILNNRIKNSSYPELDVSYDICNNIARMFLSSEEYQNNKYSTIDMLYEWLDNNNLVVDKQFAIQELEDSIILLEGNRNGMPIVLVRKNDEYAIGMNYKIDNNKISWGYGFYYGKDIDKAQRDFNRALSGRNLIYDNREDER